MCPKPCSSFGFQAMLQQWPFEFILIPDQCLSRSNSLSVFSGSGTLLRRLCSLCFDRRFHLSQSVNHSAQFPYCCASLSVFSTISLTSASKELSMSGDASFQPGSVSCLVFHTSMASDVCPKPYSSFDFSWPSESIQISGLEVSLASPFLHWGSISSLLGAQALSFMLTKVKFHSIWV